MPDWQEVFYELSKLKINVENEKELVRWLDEVVEVFRKVKTTQDLSSKAYAYVLKYALCCLLMNEARASDIAYVSGTWHSWHLAKVLIHGLELKRFNETLEVLEKGMKRIYEIYGKETLEWVVKIMFEEFQRQLGNSGVVVVN
jgi:hypothetical protein